jgi:hypothetical protein
MINQYFKSQIIDIENGCLELYHLLKKSHVGKIQELDKVLQFVADKGHVDM